MFRPTVALLALFAAPLLAQQPLPGDVAFGPVSCHYVVRATTTAVADDGFIPVDVQLRIEHPPAGWVRLEIPHWTPGSYRLRDFPDRVQVLGATAVRAGEDAPRPLEVRRLESGVWGVVGCDAAGALVVDYRVQLVDDDRFMVRGPERRALSYEGPQMFVYAVGCKSAPCTVRFDLPDGWRAASGLVERADGSFFARDYDFLADCPTKLGVFQDWAFDTAGARIRVVLDAPGEDVDFDHAAWLANIEKVVATQAAVFGGLPFERYTFLFSASRLGYGGGLEHLTSTAIGTRLAELRRGDRASISTIAHEFFHAWNVKRARPLALGPFDYTRPVRTTMLWLCEGVTSYYTSVTLARAGLSDPDRFWASMAGRIRALESSPARPHVSSAEASWTVWDDRPRDRKLDYYTSGQVLGLLLDVQIRAASANRHGLDDLVRALYEQCRTTGAGYRDEDVERHLLHLTGRDFTPWFDAHVRGTVVPDYAALLAPAGLRVEFERTELPVVRGLQRERSGDQLSWFWAPPEAGARDQRRLGGEVLALDGQPLDPRSGAQDLLVGREPGQVVTLTLRSLGGDEVERRVVLDRAPRSNCRIVVDPQAGEAAAAIRRAITGG